GLRAEVMPHLVHCEQPEHNCPEDGDDAHRVERQGDEAAVNQLKKRRALRNFIYSEWPLRTLRAFDANDRPRFVREYLDHRRWRLDLCGRRFEWRLFHLRLVSNKLYRSRL